MGDDEVFMFGSVSTRSRPKAAGQVARIWESNNQVSTRSRPKAAGPCVLLINLIEVVSTRSRPKAAGPPLRRCAGDCLVSTRSRPKAAGTIKFCIVLLLKKFQHAAARRRLGLQSLAIR